jgi:hypothetical protein
MSFYDYNVNYPSDYNNNIIAHQQRFNLLHIQPAGFIRAGFKKIKATAKIGFSLNEPTGLDRNSYGYGINGEKINTTHFHFSFGINYSL